MTERTIQEIAGLENILDNEEVLEEFSRDQSLAPRMRPRCLVKIRKAEQIQSLVKWANETSTPLIPISSGAPHFKGDTVPTAGGSIILDLSGLKNVIRIDKKNRVAMIEPGVTFAELIPQLEAAGLKMNLPLLPRANKSVIGSLLDRDPVMMPLYQWDAVDPLICNEIIFGNGDMFRTGSAGGPGTLEEQWNAKQAQVNPMGPGQTDFARVIQGSQGTMGIVTWSTVKCETLPAIQKPFIVGSDDYEKISDFVYRLMWHKSGEEIFILNRVDLSSILTHTAQEYEYLKNSLPQWIAFFVLAGFEYYPEDKIAYQEKILQSEARRFGLELSGSVTGVSGHELMRLVGQPAEKPYWKTRHNGASLDIFFLTTMDKVGSLVRVLSETASRFNYSNTDIGSYIQPMVQGSSCHCEFNLFYNPQNTKEANKMQNLYSDACEALINAGAFFSRPYGTAVDLAYGRDAETTAAMKKVKQIFDPNNVLNAGKLCF